MAKEHVKKQLEADKLERQQQAEERKRAAAGQPFSAPVVKPVTPPTTTASKDYNEARIQVSHLSHHRFVFRLVLPLPKFSPPQIH